MLGRNPYPHNSGDETKVGGASTIGASVVDGAMILPSAANGRSIAGVHISLAASVTQSSAANWTVGSLFDRLTISKNAKELIQVLDFTDLTRLFNLLTGLTAASTAYFNNPTSAGDAGTTSQTMDIFLPLHFNTSTPVSFAFKFGALSNITNAPQPQSCQPSTSTTQTSIWLTMCLSSSRPQPP
jgi:hypothetical protein